MLEDPAIWPFKTWYLTIKREEDSMAEAVKKKKEDQSKTGLDCP